MESLDPLQEELGRYEDKWVAILEPDHKIVGAGDTAFDARLDAEDRGYVETVLFKVPRFDRVPV